MDKQEFVAWCQGHKGDLVTIRQEEDSKAGFRSIVTIPFKRKGKFGKLTVVLDGKNFLKDGKQDKDKPPFFSGGNTKATKIDVDSIDEV